MNREHETTAFRELVERLESKDHVTPVDKDIAALKDSLEPRIASLDGESGSAPDNSKSPTPPGVWSTVTVAARSPCAASLRMQGELQ